MAYVVDVNGNAKTTLNVVVPTLHDKIVAGKDVIPLTVGGVVLVDKGIKELAKKAETVPVPSVPVPKPPAVPAAVPVVPKPAAKL